MRDTMTVAAWVGGAMLISMSLVVLSQHAEGEKTRAMLQAAQAHVDNRIRTLDARLTDIQADTNRKKISSVVNPPLDPKRLVKASEELDQLIGKPAPAPAPPAAAPPEAAAPAPADTGDTLTGPATAVTSDLVRICPGGHYYHRPGCKRVRKHTFTVTRADAERKGFQPCPTCKP